MRLLFVISLSLLGLFGAAVIAEKLEARRVQETYRRAAAICQALDQYLAREGKYPPSLDRLIPMYSQTIPAPAAGNRKWVYEAPRDGAYFVLGFEGDSVDYPSHFYDSKSCTWDVDTK